MSEKLLLEAFPTLNSSMSTSNNSDAPLIRLIGVRVADLQSRKDSASSSILNYLPTAGETKTISIEKKKADSDNRLATAYPPLSGVWSDEDNNPLEGNQEGPEVQIRWLMDDSSCLEDSQLSRKFLDSRISDNSADCEVESVLYSRDVEWPIELHENRVQEDRSIALEDGEDPSREPERLIRTKKKREFRAIGSFDRQQRRKKRRTNTAFDVCQVTSINIMSNSESHSSDVTYDSTSDPVSTADTELDQSIIAKLSGSEVATFIANRRPGSRPKVNKVKKRSVQGRSMMEYLKPK